MHITPSIGPGTKLRERLERGDKPINKLDALCLDHDLAYEKTKDSAERREADKKLASEAAKLIFSKETGFKEKLASATVAGIMKAKTKFGGGLVKKTKKTAKKVKKIKKKAVRRPKKITFKKVVQEAKVAIRSSKPKTVDEAINSALKSVQKYRKNNQIKSPRVLKLPKTTFSGGILPIVPSLIGLSALGSIINSGINIYKTAKAIRSASNEIQQKKLTAPIKVGKGLYLHSPKGAGLYLKVGNQKNY